MTPEMENIVIIYSCVFAPILVLFILMHYYNLFKRLVNWTLKYHLYHIWKYRNPACRTCKVCHKNEHFWGWNVTGISPIKGSWEENVSIDHEEWKKENGL